MDLLAQAADGFRGINADPQLKEQAQKYLRLWLASPEFAAYRPQLEWLIQTRQWPGLLDRFYQILPFGTGGRRGPVVAPVAGPHRPRRDPGPADRDRQRARAAVPRLPAAGLAPGRRPDAPDDARRQDRPDDAGRAWRRDRRPKPDRDPADPTMPGPDNLDERLRSDRAHAISSLLIGRSTFALASQARPLGGGWAVAPRNLATAAARRRASR